MNATIKLSILLLVIQNCVLAQTDTHTVRGEILDENNQPLIGASIQTISYEKGTNSDIKGRFELSGVHLGDTLIGEFIGYTCPDFVVAKPVKNILIKCTPETSSLPEIIFIAGNNQEYRESKIKLVDSLQNYANQHSWTFDYLIDRPKDVWLQTNADHLGYLLKKEESENLVIVFYTADYLLYGRKRKTNGYYTMRDTESDNYLFQTYLDFIDIETHNKHLTNYLSKLNNPNVLFIPYGELIDAIFPLQKVSEDYVVKNKIPKLSELLYKQLNIKTIFAYCFMKEGVGFSIDAETLKHPRLFKILHIKYMMTRDSHQK